MAHPKLPPAPNGENPVPPLDPVAAGLVRTELERIVESPQFRSSKRCRQFLTHVVEQALAGHFENLKERTIGMAVFDRAPSYDTSEDATVRVTANEVRKRLAQYHLEAGAAAGARLELPPGSYVPEFHMPQERPETAVADDPAAAARPASGSAWKRVSWKGAGLVLGLAATAGLAMWALQRHPSTPFDQFWAPLIESPRPALVCNSNPTVWIRRGDLVPEDLRGQPQQGDHAPVAVLPPGAKNPTYFIASPDMYVGAGDAYTSGQVLMLLGRKDKPGQLRIGEDISFADLRNFPAVLIGAYANRWTMQVNQDVRFAFAARSIVDRAKPGQSWRVTRRSPDWKSDEDYAVIARILQSHTGEPVYVAAGITSFGTQAAGEFLTDPSYLNQALARFPAGWQTRNLQLVLYCKVTGRTPGPPKVIATHVW